MKSFSQFWEEASADAEERTQKRKLARERAVKEAARRKEAAKKYTQRNRKKMLAKRAEAEAKFAQQRQSAKELKAKREAQQAQAKQKAAQTGRNIRQAIKGTTELGTAAVKGIRRAVQKHKAKKQQDTSQTDT